MKRWGVTMIKCEICESYTENRDSQDQILVLKGVEHLACYKCWVDYPQCIDCGKYFEEDAVTFDKETGNAYYGKCGDRADARAEYSAEALNEAKGGI